MWVRQGKWHCLEIVKDTSTSEPVNGSGGERTYKVEGVRATRAREYGFGRWLLKSLGIRWHLACRLFLCEQMSQCLFLLQVGRKVNIDALVASIVDRTISVVDMAHDKNIREGMLNRADLFRTCRNTYNLTISKSPIQIRSWFLLFFNGGFLTGRATAPLAPPLATAMMTAWGPCLQTSTASSKRLLRCQ